MNKQKYISETKKRYHDRFKKHGKSRETLGWYKGNQDKRYAALVKHINLTELKILEVGCGFGEGIDFLKRTKSISKYLGIDISEEFIKIAQKKFSSGNINFTSGSFHDIEIKSNNFDICIASGVFNFNEKHLPNYDLIQDFIKFSFEHGAKIVAFDLLSFNCDKRNDNNFYPSLEELTKVLNIFSRRYIIDHSALPFEITITIFKDDSLDYKISQYKKDID
jgi:SAM-dependent methyltransferase